MLWLAFLSGIMIMMTWEIKLPVMLTVFNNVYHWIFNELTNCMLGGRTLFGCETDIFK